MRIRANLLCFRRNVKRITTRSVLVLSLILISIVSFFLFGSHEHRYATRGFSQHNYELSKKLFQKHGGEEPLLSRLPFIGDRFHKEVYAILLRHNGYDSVEQHSFTSPLISDPPIASFFEAKLKYNHTKVPGNRLVKLIAFHNTFLSDDFYTRGEPDFSQCPITECAISKEQQRDTNNNKQMTVPDILWFSCDQLQNPPTERPPGQLWVLACWYPPLRWKYNADDYRSYMDAFNMTVGYRQDADVFMPRMSLAWTNPESQFTSDKYVEIAKFKKQTAAWFPDNCDEHLLEYVQEMQKYIDVDIFGKCGKSKCNDVHAQCLLRSSRTYHFFLAFEDTFCQDYVTDIISPAFYKGHHVIPVWQGGYNYNYNTKQGDTTTTTTYFPENTFVDGNTFESAKELALYLKELAADKPRYAKMLQEKDKLAALDFTSFKWDWCDLCEKLHTKRFGVYRNIWRWSHRYQCDDNYKGYPYRFNETKEEE